MSPKLSRRDLKRNDLAETVGRTMDYVTHHRKGAREAIFIAVGLVVLVGGFLLWRDVRERSAARHLSAGLAELAVPLASDPTAANAPKTYATADQRTREADKHLRQAASKKGTTAGRAAAVILATRSNPAEARETLARAARDGKKEIAAVAEIDIARLLAAEGKATEAIDRLKRAIESPETAAPKDALLFALAQIYERAGSSGDARATYQRLVNDYPESPYTSDARQKVQ